MPDPFFSAKRSLRRGYHHIGDLGERLNVINQADEYATFAVEPQPDGTTEILKVNFHPLFRDEFPCIVFDAVSNLRACLDQMTYAIAARGGLTKDAAYFPICKGPEFIDDQINGLKYLPPAIKTLFRSFNPYKGGDDALWALNTLCNIKKHAALVPIDLAKVRFNFQILPKSDPLSEFMRHGVQLAEVGGPMRIGGHTFDAEENQITVGTFAVGSNAKTKTEVTFAVVLDHPEPVIRGQHPIFLLSHIAQSVKRVLADTEAECRRIGLFA